MKNQFEIGIENPTPNENGLALGFITVGDFHEHFSLFVNDWPAMRYQRQWQEALSCLVKGRTPVALMCQMISPGINGFPIAWILYREGDAVFIHQALFTPDSKWKVDASGRLVSFEPREIETEDGTPISEWRTDINAIEAFLKSKVF